MRPHTESKVTTRKPDSFTAEERRQLIELGQVVRQAAGNKSKKEGRVALSGITPAQRELLVRWLAYRMGGGG